MAKIADEAVKQCGRTIKPTVEAIVSLEQLAKDYADYTRFICYEAEDEQSFKRCCNQQIVKISYLDWHRRWFCSRRSAIMQKCWI